jgi:hypothetical protein
MSGILDQFEDIADANDIHGNTRDRRGAKRRGKMPLFLENNQKRKTIRSRIRLAQAASLRARQKSK